MEADMSGPSGWNDTELATDQSSDYYYYYNYSDYDYRNSQAFLEYKMWGDRVSMMWKVTCPMVFLVGNFGNVMIMLVLRKMVSETSAFPILFMALALTDLLLLYVVLLPRWIHEQFDHWVIDTSNGVCKLMTWLEYSLVTLSAWLLVAMTGQRALNIVCPIRMRGVKPRLTAVVTISILVGFSFVFNSFTLHGMTTQHPASEAICWWMDDFKIHARPVLDWLEFVFNSVLPSALMVVCNCLMIVAVTQSAQRMRARKSDSSGGMVSRVTVTLIVVSLTFIVLTLPFYIMQIVQQNHPELEYDGPFHFWFNMTSLMWIINSAINFFLYILTGSRFREEGKKLFRGSEASSGHTRSTSDSGGSQMKTTDF